ncbi:MAG TPA: class I SAM-dependent methyltransferase [Anaerolineales bacterium]|nr:class I SAM-dependent methyltransferase [Anaerolineales bacterium]
MPGGRYVTALSFRWLTTLYDSLVEGPQTALGMRRGLLISLGDLSGRKVLDVGNGTGTFAMLLRQSFPDCEVAGLDGDPRILEQARKKASRVGLPVEFTEAMSYSMPYPDGSFDVVTTTLVLHHLSKDAKQATAHEM